MKRTALFISLAIGLISFRAPAKTFEPKIFWCNGPIQEGDPGSCPSYGHWHGVQLKALASITIPTASTEKNVQLTDREGRSWEMDLKSCNTPTHKPIGCSHSLELPNPGQVELSMDEWRFGQTTRIHFTLSIDNELSILAPDQSHLMFKLVEKAN